MTGPTTLPPDTLSLALGPGQRVSALPDPPPAPDPVGPLVPGPHVSAVLVIGPEAADHLPRVLQALRSQTRPPDTLVAVRIDGADPETDLLTGLADHVLRTQRRVCFGDGVRAALAALDSLGRPEPHPRPEPDRGSSARRPYPVPSGPVSWLWLLHDDGAPAPQALERLLEAVEKGPSIGIAGCKQVTWGDDQQLRDVGFTTSRLGTVITGLDLFEVDQGQHDERSDVLAVCEAGMLVRRDVWDSLGGTDPALGTARTDLDLCRRAHLSGHRVVVVPDAVLAHAGSSRVGDLPVRGSSYRADRRAVLHLRLAGTPFLLLPLVVSGVLAAAPYRCAVALLRGGPLRALDEILATVRVLAGPISLLRTARRIRSARCVPRRTLRPLLATRRQLWVHHRNRSVLRRAAGRKRLTGACDWGDAAVAGGTVAAGGAAIGGREGSRPAEGSVSTRSASASPAQGTGPSATTTAPATSAGPATPTAPTTSATSLTDCCLTSDSDNSGEPGTGTGTGPGTADTLAVAAPTGVSTDAPTRAVRRHGLPVRSRGMTGERSVLGLRRGFPTTLGTLLTTMLLASVVGLRDLLGPGTPRGPFLMPVPATTGHLWSSANSGWRPVGLGGAAVADPFALVLAMVSWCTGGRPGPAVTVVLLAGAPVSALVGFWAAGKFTPSKSARWWAALAWGGAPSLLTALAQGRPAGVLAHILLPVVAVAVARSLRWGWHRGERHRALRDLPRRGSVRAAVAAGLLLTVLLACAPSLTAAAGVLLALTACFCWRRGPLLLITMLLPVALLLPWWWAVAERPVLLLADPAPAAADGSVWWHLLGWPTSPRELFGPAGAMVRDLLGIGGPLDVFVLGIALVTAVPTLLLAVAGVVRSGNAGRVALCAWGVGLAGMTSAVAAERVGVAQEAPGTGIGWAGPGTSLCTAGILAAALCLWLPTVREAPIGPRRRARSSNAPAGRRPTRMAGVGILLLAIVGPVTTIALWARACAVGNQELLVHASTSDVLPGPAAAEGLSPAATRTLVLRTGGNTVTWSLASADGPRFGDTSAALAAELRGPDQDRTPVRSTDEIVRPVVARLLSGTETDLRQDLENLAVGSVYVMEPVLESTANALDSSPGLVRSAVDRTGVLWRVEPDPDSGRTTRPAWARILDSDGQTVSALPSTGSGLATRLPEGSADRTLVLSARSDPGWRATLDGRSLTPGTRWGWAQSFELPQEAGRLVVRHDAPEPAGGGAARGAVLLMALVLLLPWRVPGRRQVLLPRPSRPITRGPEGVSSGSAPPPQVYDAEHPERGEPFPVLTDPPRRLRWRSGTRAAAQGGQDDAVGQPGAGVPPDAGGLSGVSAQPDVVALPQETQATDRTGVGARDENLVPEPATEAEQAGEEPEQEPEQGSSRVGRTGRWWKRW